MQRASVVAWSDEEHVERGPRVATRASGTSVSTLSRRGGLRVAGGAATMYLWLGVPTGETSEDFAARLLEHGVLRRARLVPRRRPARATSGSRSCRRSRSASAPRRSWRTSCERPRRAHRRALGRRTSSSRSRSRRRSRCSTAARCAWRSRRRRRLGASTSGRRRRSSSTSACARSSRSRPAPFEFLDKIPLKRDFAERGVRVVPRRRRALRRVPLPGRRADARLRQHRRLGRAADDGRHVGDRGLLRADRRGRPPLGRRRHRRRARAAAGARR